MAHHASTATALKRKCPEPEEEETAGMCTTSCGYHGATTTGNMCSKCYRQHVASDTTAADSVFVAPTAASTAPPEKKAKTIVSVASSDGMCVNNCGFHDGATTGNMCSKCYKEHVASDTTTEASVFAPTASTASPEKKDRTIVSVASSDGAIESSVTPMKPPMAASNRCATCRKKVGLLVFRCRCEGTFCSAPLLREKHDCGFDHKTAGQEKIAKHNPVVVADKMATRI